MYVFVSHVCFSNEENRRFFADTGPTDLLPYEILASSKK